MSKAAELAALIGSQSALSNRNLIINGAMQVAQRGASAVTVSDGSNEGYTTVDRYYLNFNASIGGAIAVSQSTDTPSGFANSIKLDCTTANTSISGTQMIDLQHRFEAQDLQQLGFGSSDAQPITVSWYMKAVSFSDNISVTLNTRDGTKEYFVKSFTPTTSWARYTMTVPGSTSATIDNNNGEGLRLSWVVAGSSSGTHAASSDSTAFSTTRADYRNDIGNLTASTDNELYITGVQLELGEQATPFEHRSFGDELRRCQRYYWKSVNHDTTPANNIANSNNLHSDGYGSWTAYATTNARTPYFPHPVAMRAAPTVTLYSSERANTAGKTAIFNGTWGAVSSNATQQNENRFAIYCASSGLTANNSYLFAGGWACDSEL